MHKCVSIFLLPANKVCEGYVFTGVCLSTMGGRCTWFFEGACIVFWGAEGGMHGFFWGVHVFLGGVHVFLGGVHGFFGGHVGCYWGGMHGFFRGHAWLRGGHVWLPGGVHRIQ